MLSSIYDLLASILLWETLCDRAAVNSLSIETAFTLMGGGCFDYKSELVQACGWHRGNFSQ
jgi:hypothetical protein